jgi:predicted TPR repeat methyltransferase
VGASKQRKLASIFEDGLSAHREGRLEDAERAYDELLRADAKHRGALNMRGVLELQRGDAAPALQYFDRAVAVDPESAGTHLNRGNALRALGRGEEALASYDRALAIDPRMAIAHVNRGNVLRDQSELADAAAAYRQALEIDADNFAAAANLASVEAQQSSDPTDEMFAAHEALLAVAERRGLRGPDIARVLESLGRLHRRAADFDAAIEAYRTACDHDPRSAAAHSGLGSALSAAGRYGEALDAVRRASELEPSATGHLDALAIQLRRLGRNDEAAAIYRRWSELDPDNPIPAHMHLALTGGAAPETASAEYVRREFDGFAAVFDDMLRSKLDYRAPELVTDVVRDLLRADPRRLAIADLGCGTGLCGPLLRPFASRLVGVDLSSGMLARAVDRGYDELVEADIVDYCRAHRAEFDLLVAADVLVYIGALVDLFSAARASLLSGGHFVFTVEHNLDDPREFRLNAGGRYAHHDAYVRRALEDAGFTVLTISPATLRTELSTPVMGLLVSARAS